MTSDYDTERTAGVVVATAIALIATAAATLSGCGTPAPSPATFQLAQSIHLVARTKSAERIEMVAAAITEAATAGEISDRDAARLEDVLASAEAGDWDEAVTDSRRLMGDRR